MKTKLTAEDIFGIIVIVFILVVLFTQPTTEETVVVLVFGFLMYMSAGKQIINNK